jgi:hypothetical protein
VFTADTKIISLITEWRFPDNGQPKFLNKSNMCMDQEIRFSVFKYKNFNEGVIKGDFFWILSINPLLWCVGSLRICNMGKGKLFINLKSVRSPS